MKFVRKSTLYPWLGPSLSSVGSVEPRDFGGDERTDADEDTIGWLGEFADFNWVSAFASSRTSLVRPADCLFERDETEAGEFSGGLDFVNLSLILLRGGLTHLLVLCCNVRMVHELMRR